MNKRVLLHLQSTVWTNKIQTVHNKWLVYNTADKALKIKEWISDYISSLLPSMYGICTDRHSEKMLDFCEGILMVLMVTQSNTLSTDCELQRQNCTNQSEVCNIFLQWSFSTGASLPVTAILPPLIIVLSVEGLREGFLRRAPHWFHTSGLVVRGAENADIFKYKFKTSYFIAWLWVNS